LALLVAKCVFVVVLFVGILTPLASWIESRQGALMQDRIGANRAGVAGITAFGLLQPLSDLIKLLSKENLVPAGTNRLLHGLAPLTAIVPAIAMFAVIPYGGVYALGSTQLSLVGADIDWGLLYIFALGGLATLGPLLAGWTSGGTGSRLGGVRSAAQTVSYGVAMGLAIVGVLMVFGTLKLTEMAAVQDSTLRIAGFLDAFEVAVPEWASRFPFTLPNWGIVLQPVGFVLFLPCMMAASGQPPFDLGRADEELAGGYATEYSGMRLGLFEFAERVQVVAIAGLMTSLFLGGWSVPWLSTGTIVGAISPLLGEAFATLLCMVVHVASFLAKLVAMIWLQMLIRWSLPRFRYDQLMNLCWKVIVPLSIANIFATAVVLLLLLRGPV
jgi:NADH-quinone oxidoreductase subunit H